MPVRGHLLPVLCTGLLALAPAGSVPRHPATMPDSALVVLESAPAAADLAIRFESLLGQHSVLAADLMRSRIRGDDDFVQAANAALGKNTAAMTALVRQMFGAPAAQAFSPKWSQHIVALFAYAGAVANQDESARKDAEKQLTAFEKDLGAFFAGASKGRLAPAAAQGAVVQHVRHLTEQADSYAKGDYATADAMYRMGYQHTYDLGLALANALLPAADAKTLSEPMWRLRSQLGRLLAEHAVLVEDVTRAAVTNTPDFDASGDMINGNTRDLTAAMDTLFGAAAAKRFQSLWSDHVDSLVEYAAGTAAENQVRKQRARDGLHDFEKKMADFLTTATGKRVSAKTLSAALLNHDEMLLRHADAYAARDYASAHDIAYDTYDHMFELARQLADAFGATVAAKLPHGGAQTGYGGMATVVESR